MEIEWLDGEWIEVLLWCPSQLYRRAKVGSKIYTLYLRWRWEDPWRFYVIEGDAKPGAILAYDFRSGEAGEVAGFTPEGDIVIKPLNYRFVTNDLFEENGLFFRDEEYKEAERVAEEIFLKWVEERLS